MSPQAIRKRTKWTRSQEEKMNLTEENKYKRKKRSIRSENARCDRHLRSRRSDRVVVVGEDPLIDPDDPPRVKFPFQGKNKNKKCHHRHN